MTVWFEVPNQPKAMTPPRERSDISITPTIKADDLPQNSMKCPYGMDKPMTELTNQSMGSHMKVRALFWRRIDTSGLEHSDVLSTVPLAFRAGQDGVVTVFRYGVVVFFGLSVLERTRCSAPAQPDRGRSSCEDETATIEIARIGTSKFSGGPILLKAITPEHMMVIADASLRALALRTTKARWRRLSKWSSHWPANLPITGARAAVDARFSNTSAMHSWFNIGSQAASRSPINLTRCGSVPTWRGSTHAFRTSTNLRRGPKLSRANFR